MQIWKMDYEEGCYSMKKHSAPTMKDVAREAGVSLGTVSKVINHKPVGDEYVRKVKAAIQKLDYHVNTYAQGLKASKTDTVALLIPTSIHTFYSYIISYVNKALLKRGYRMLLCCSDYDPKLEQEYINMAQQNKVDGIIALSYNPAPVIDPELPFVSIDRTINEHIPVVSSDNYAGGALAAQKLKEFGCTKAAFLREGSSLDNEPNKRRAGFEYGAQKYHLDYDLCLLEDGHPKDAFYHFLKNHYHNGRLDYDGLFCVTDTLAFKIGNILKEMNIRVPEDVQIIGFDGAQHFGDRGYVCSTIVQPVEDIAEMAVELLLQDQTRMKPQLVCLPVHFAEGGTTRSGQSYNTI